MVHDSSSVEIELRNKDNKSMLSDIEDLNHALRWKRVKTRIENIFTSWIFYTFLIILIWFVSGCFFYAYYLSWPASASFYFAAQAGLSVGFGIPTYNLTQERDGALIFTVYLVLAGSAIVSYALSIFIDGQVGKQDAYFKDEMKAARRVHVYNQRLSKIHSTWGKRMFRLRSALSRFHQIYRMPIIAVCVFVLWIAIGVIFAMTHEHYTFAKALLFATAALSTGGLIGVSASSNLSLWFTGFYVLTGVPAYAFVISQIAGALVERQERKRFKQMINASITSDEFEYAQSLGEADGVIDEQEFILMSLLRMGAVDKDRLARIKARFKTLDINGDGKFTKNEMQVALAYDKWDEDGSGNLDIEEFCGLCFDLCEEHGGVPGISFSGVDQVERIFLDIDKDRTGLIKREEFFEWWRKLEPIQSANAQSGGGDVTDFLGGRASRPQSFREPEPPSATFTPLPDQTS